MAMVRAGSIKDVPPGRMMEHTQGEDRYVICNVEGTLYALDGTCPHRGGPLAHGALHGEAVVCPFHAWEFNCRSGEYDYDPGIVLRRFSVELRGDDIYIEVP